MNYEILEKLLEYIDSCFATAEARNSSDHGLQEQMYKRKVEEELRKLVRDSQPQNTLAPATPALHPLIPHDARHPLDVLAELKELEELRRDKARLDWLFSRKTMHVGVATEFRYEDRDWVLDREDLDDLMRDQRTGNAIDAAMNEGGE